MLLSEIFERFIEQSPITVMVRGLLEKALAPEKLDELFERTAKVQYTRELLFSEVVNLMSLVVCGIRPSVNAAYRAKAQEIGVSRTALYDKLNGIEPEVSAAVVRHTAIELEPVVKQLRGQLPDLLAGYRVKILDGNSLGTTEHRLALLRTVRGGALPGKSLVVLDPTLMLAIDVFPCEDGYAGERALLDQVVAIVAANDVWIADRNMCTRSFLFGIAQRQAYFVIRQHQGMSWQPLDELRSVGSVETGEVFEQQVRLHHDGQELTLRRVLVRLVKPTRDGESEIAVLSNLPSATADGKRVAQLYRERWSVETLFQVVSETFKCEIKSLGYPKAALFSFCMALVAYNILSVVKAALRGVHGVGKIEAGLSDYYLAEEIQGTYRGMMIAIAPTEWEVFAQMQLTQLCSTLRQLASHVNLKALCSTPRGPKKPRPERIHNPRQCHVSTARLLAQAKSFPP
jgi:hypothetical protein